MRETAYYEKTARAVTQTRDRTAVRLRETGWTVLPSSTNFLFIKHPTVPGPTALRKLRENGILVRHFTAPRITDYLRVTIGTDEDMDKFVKIAQLL
jgi:histidinol-phosphate aminotransferase